MVSLSNQREQAWAALEIGGQTLAELFAADPERVAKLSARLELGPDDAGGGVLFDWSKTHLTDALLEGFEALAEAAGFAEQRRRLFAGEVVNPTENRAAEHAALRGVGKAASVEGFAVELGPRCLVECAQVGENCRRW